MTETKFLLISLFLRRDFGVKNRWIVVLAVVLFSFSLETQAGAGNSQNARTSVGPGAGADIPLPAKVSKGEPMVKLPDGLVLDAELTRSVDAGKAVKDEEVSA